MSAVVAGFHETFTSEIATSVDERGRITATASREFTAICEAPHFDNIRAVKQYGGCPREKSGHPYDSALRCVNLRVGSGKGHLDFVVKADYRSLPYSDADDQNPLNQPTVVTYGSVTSEEAIDEDWNGAPIATKVGERFQNVTRQFTDQTIQLKKNFADYDPSAFDMFRDAVNSDSFLTFAPGRLKVMSIGADEQFYEGVPFWSVTVNLQDRKPYRLTNYKAWWKRIRHEGFYQAVPDRAANGAPARCLDNFTRPTTTPQPLDANGVQIVLRPDNTPSSNITWLEFQLYPYVSFAAMGF